MLRLSDDCLSSIFDHLGLRDQLRLTAVSERFRDIILAVQWRSRFRRFQTSASSESDAALSNEESQSILKLISHRIEHLVVKRHLTIYLRFEFPKLRVLECKDLLVWQNVSKDDMELIAAHCPLIEKLVLPVYISSTVCSNLAHLRHLRVLHVSHTILKECDLQQILTLPLTELRIWSFWGSENRRSLAEALIGASDLRVFIMQHCHSSQDLIQCMFDVASTTELRDPLTVYINYKLDVNEDRKYDQRHKDDYNYYYFNYNILQFQEYQQSLQVLIDMQCPGSPHTILLSKRKIECRFFVQSNKK